MLLTNPTCTL